jgi:hypothetical protein
MTTTGVLDICGLFNREVLDGLADRHGIKDVRAFYTAMIEAKTSYQSTENWFNTEFDGTPDTLKKFSRAIDAVLRLLERPVNSYRLMRALVEIGDPTSDVVEELQQRRAAGGSHIMTSLNNSTPAMPWVDDVVLILMKYKLLAKIAHQGPGKPTDKRALRVAYDWLYKFWRESGPAKFTNGWRPTDCGRLEPTSKAACFFYDAFFLICPGRADVAQELRALMANTVKLC